MIRKEKNERKKKKNLSKEKISYIYIIYISKIDATKKKKE